jgi:hypothetical protein
LQHFFQNFVLFLSSIFVLTSLSPSIAAGEVFRDD